MKQPKAQNVSSNRVEWIVGLISSIAFITADQFIGIGASIKVLGVTCISVGLVWFFKRHIPVGIEGRAPIAEVGSIGAKVAGIALCIVGVLMCLFSTHVACIFGWAQDQECSSVKW